ncbi:P-selectin-like [Brevipalpus obovatus]|uniref:P-selectin-like n=1 Tax=Brevipalpus obovatus TaxID=246614 RepID=UPI003D9E6EDC
MLSSWFQLSFILCLHFLNLEANESQRNQIKGPIRNDQSFKRNRFTCTTLQPPPYGSMECDNYYDPYKCVFQCQPGYQLDGPYEVYCENGQWRPYTTQPVCIRTDSVVGGGSIGGGGNGISGGGSGLGGHETCPPLRNPVYGSIEGECGPNPRAGDTCYFYCERGYGLQGTSVLRCREDGLWSNQPPLCVRNTAGISGGSGTGGEVITGGGGNIGGGGSGYRYCQDIEYYDGVSYSGTCRSGRPGDRCYMRCSEYVTASRPIEVVAICLENGYWSNSPPRCRAPGFIGQIIGGIISRVLPKDLKGDELPEIINATDITTTLATIIEN